MCKLFQNLIKKLLFNQEEDNIETYIQKRYNEEKQIAPTIAIIGETGVGKSTTINSLFGTSLRVSNTIAGTKSPNRLSIYLKARKVKGPNGDLILYDMPGINEDLDNEIAHIEMYREIIEKCDVFVWVISAADRGYSYAQSFIHNFTKYYDETFADKLVFAINKVDLVMPLDWDMELNLPSEEQEKNFRVIRKDVYTKFKKVCPNLTKDRVVVYSALRRYRLDDLFVAMLNACPDDRAWILISRQSIDNFWDYVSPKIREQVELVVGDIK